ncbi:ABC-type transport auxiliary lipoprotein family protein [Orbus mooreae]|uniref:ABC-type transport auxiliary lipoprotein family protein n=1 Tax=Orbus mooreae TaxID=3074107 RepID=UPI00370D290E
MKKLIMISLLLLLAGCSSTAPNRTYYQLTSDFSIDNLQLQKVDNVAFIDSVTVASYLDTTGIVYQTDAIEYSTARNNLWLTALSNQIQQRVVTDLSVLLPNYFVTTEPVSNPRIRIKLYIDGFHGSYTGDAIIEGRWVINYGNNNIVTKNIDARLRLSEDGYAALVKTLSKGWQEEEIELIRSIKW